MLQGREGDGPGQGHSWGRTRLLLCLHKLKVVVAQSSRRGAETPPFSGKEWQGLKDLSESPGPDIICSETWRECFQLTEPQLCDPESETI